ncbi:helix-turn-helix domain-containing protein [bacterium]|nr:helix-turn-helix domain-containing protein [bacterium]
MPEYLTKEEIKEWRSSLEKITLEEFAARRGKVLEEQKHTNDLIDIVMKGQPVITKIESFGDSEKITTIKPLSKQVSKPGKKESVKPESVKNVKQEVKETKPVKEKSAEKKPTAEKPVETVAGLNYAGVEFEKPLTDREQKVFEMFYKHAGKIVYAKDLADLLALPRDYVYKYIKTLRAKIKGDKLENADKGGYVLRI